MPFRSFTSPRATLTFLAVCVALDYLAQSLTFPILPRLARRLLAGDAVAAARWVGWLEVGWAASQLLAAPLLGALSDRFGRRPVIVLSLLGVAGELTMNALAPSIGWLLAGRVLCGLACGGQAAALAAAADVAPTEGRAGAFARLGAAMWAGIVLGPALGGMLSQFGLRAPFWAGAGAAMAAALFAGFFLGESLPQARRAPFQLVAAAPWRGARILLRPALRAPAAALLLSWLAFQGKDNMIVLYTAHRYGWSAFDFGVFCTALAAAGIAVQTGLAARAVRRLGERGAALAGLALQGAGMTVMGLAATGAWFWAANVPAVLGAVAAPALQALVSRVAGEDEQGRVQGAISQIASFSGLVAPPIFTQLFAWTISDGHDLAWSGATILIAAGLTLAAMVVVAVNRGKKNPGPRGGIVEIAGPSPTS